MSDVKSLLKEARKLIDDNKYNEAQECCKNILRKDKQNYLGLILLGKSLQDSDQAPLAYQKAIACKKDNPLAWQGLASYYERYDNIETKAKLLSVYDEMLKLQLDDEKFIEIIKKIGIIGATTKDPLSIIILTGYLSEKHDPILTNTAEKELISLLKCNVPYDFNKLESFLNILISSYDNNPGDIILEMTIVKAIVSKNNNILNAIQEIKMLPFYSSNKSVREFLCKQIFFCYMNAGAQNINQIEDIFDTLTKDIADYKYTGLLKSVFLFEKRQYQEAFKECVQLIDYEQPEKYEVMYIINCCLMLKKWSVTHKLITNFLKKINNCDKEFLKELNKLLFVSLIKQRKYLQAYPIIKDYINENDCTIEQKALLAECFIEMNDQQVDRVLQNLEKTEYFASLKALQLIKLGNYLEAKKLLENQTLESNLIFYYLGVVHWNLENYDESHINLLKAAKLDADHSYTFLYLGHFYKVITLNLDKARKCYEKANDILPFNNLITLNLSDTYHKLGLQDMNYNLLCILENSELKDTAWVNFRLGLHYLKEGNAELAITKFREVLKSSPTPTVLECLANAYFSRGSYTSALKAYEKTISLDTTKVSYCLTRIGYINMLLTQYTEAISNFEQVLLINPHSILALKGLSETWMKVAEKKLVSKLYGSARDCAQFAVDYIARAISGEKRFISYFKILGDALMFITKLPRSYVHVYIRRKGNEELGKIEKIDIFWYAISCYSQVMKLKNETYSYDLSAAYLALYTDPQEQTYCQTSHKLILSNVQNCAPNWYSWNLMGKIFFLIKKYNLSQHCFIKAINLSRKLPIATIWCNLGTLYLKLKLYKLANYCYWRGQSILPSYPHSWIGQALIAETIREEEAMDLFRHATRLGYHRESALGYSDWVCRTLQYRDLKEPNVRYDIYGLHAIPYAIDLLQWLCSFEDDNSCGYTMLGMLQERFGLIRAAKQSYENALKNVEDKNKNILLLNLGRIYVRLQQYDKAIKSYKAITEASINSACGLALSLYKNGLYEEAYSTYDTALHWLSDQENDKSDVLVAMAGIVYMFKGAAEAKLLLFQSIQMSQKKPTAYSLFASCSLGILHSDENLSKLALRELQKYEKDINISVDIGFLKSFLFVHNENIEDGIKSLSDSIYDNPDSSRLWFYLALYCLQASKAKVASACAQKALCSNNAYVKECECPAEIFATASIAEHAAKRHDLGLLLAKRGVHLYPYQPEVWAALIYSFVTNKIHTETTKRQWLLATIKLMKQLNTSRGISRWTTTVEKKLLQHTIK